jgi:tRNA threonylcarbamoyladenosine biosynthesis protein TsaE
VISAVATIALPSRRATIHLAAKLARAIAPSDLVVLDGDLGAGKTFFARAFLRALGIPHATPVTSPTFTLVHEYETERLPILHADLYRVTDEDEVIALGLRDRRNEGAALLVEWGAPYASALGGDALFVRLEDAPSAANAAARAAHLTPTGARSEALAEKLAVT